jgi:hypothetical protein
MLVTSPPASISSLPNSSIPHNRTVSFSTHNHLLTNTSILIILCFVTLQGIYPSERPTLAMAVPKKPSGTKTAITETLTSTVPSIRNNVQSAQVLEQPVEFLQSLELVQTLVCAVVSTVASLRGIFPEDCFKVHRFDVENLNYSYKDFIEASNEENVAVINPRDKKGHRYVPWEILSRGKNTSVNKLLDWLVGFSVEICSHPG